MGATGFIPVPGGANTIPAAGHRLKESLPPGHHCGRGLAGRRSRRPSPRRPAVLFSRVPSVRTSQVPSSSRNSSCLSGHRVLSSLLRNGNEQGSHERPAWPQRSAGMAVDGRAPSRAPAPRMPEPRLARRRAAATLAATLLAVAVLGLIGLGVEDHLRPTSLAIDGHPLGPRRRPRPPALRRLLALRRSSCADRPARSSARAATSPPSCDATPP